MLDMGMRSYRQEIIRLAGIDCPELRPRKKGRNKISLANERQRAVKAADYAHAELSKADAILVKTQKDAQSFNRYVAEIWYRQGDDWAYLADKIAAAGFRKRKSEMPK